MLWIFHGCLAILFNLVCSAYKVNAKFFCHALHHIRTKSVWNTSVIFSPTSNILYSYSTVQVQLNQECLMCGITISGSDQRRSQIRPLSGISSGRSIFLIYVCEKRNNNTEEHYWNISKGFVWPGPSHAGQVRVRHAYIVSFLPQVPLQEKRADTSLSDRETSIEYIHVVPSGRQLKQSVKVFHSLML